MFFCIFLKVSNEKVLFLRICWWFYFSLFYFFFFFLGYDILVNDKFDNSEINRLFGIFFKKKKPILKTKTSNHKTQKKQ